MKTMIQNNEYIEFLKTRKKNDIILIKNEIKDDIKKLNKDIKKINFNH